MIVTVAEFLEAVIEQQKKKLARYHDLKHGPMIGDIYEGLTKEILQASIFTGLDIRVLEGKIRNSTGNLSRQIDCMVVTGDGEKIPFTDHYIYPVEQVIAVVEVKALC